MFSRLKLYILFWLGTLNAEKGKKKRRRKDSEPSKDKDTAGSSKKGKASSQPSKIDKSVNAHETIQEAAMETKELVQENVINAEEQPKDDVAPKQDNSIWFKQDVVIRSETPYPEWHKELNLDWENPEGDKRPYDMSKPLPLQGPPGHLTILVDFFFNNDLEYLKTGNKERKYVASLTKTKATRYDLKGIEDMIPRRVEDVQFGVESYQKKLKTTCDGMSFKESYIIFFEPRAVVYMNKSNRKRLMRADDLYKFYDGMLKSVRNNLHEMLHNFVLGYNHGMLKRDWTEKDQKRTDEIMKLIANLLLERRITRSLECFVGGRMVEMDYRLLTRTV
ncbi:hypothetical protein Tco_0489305 [Tanacetum coccineum]